MGKLGSSIDLAQCGSSVLDHNASGAVLQSLRQFEQEILMRAQATSPTAVFWYAVLFAIVVAMLVFTLSRPAADTTAAAPAPTATTAAPNATAVEPTQAK